MLPTTVTSIFVYCFIVYSIIVSPVANMQKKHTTGSQVKSTVADSVSTGITKAQQQRYIYGKKIVKADAYAATRTPHRKIRDGSVVAGKSANPNTGGGALSTDGSVTTAVAAIGPLPPAHALSLVPTPGPAPPAPDGGRIADPGTGIGTITAQGVMTDGSTPFKTCYVGSSVCSGGVGAHAPVGAPTHALGLDSPSASSGTANAVGVFSMQTQYPADAYTDALFTPSNRGLGVLSAATNFARDFYLKVAYPAGTAHIEFDTFAASNGWLYMFGVQCNGSKKIIQYDNQGHGWVDTPVPCGVLRDGNYHHVKQTFHRDLASHTEWFDTITIDGTTYAIGKSLPATSSPWRITAGQWQIDVSPTSASLRTPATATLYVDTDIVTAGDAASTSR